MADIPRTARELRRAFTDFFAAHDHEVVPSASVIPHDPTVLFTVAGMVPFKPYFTGAETPPFRRATSVQKCVRAGGKHNDLDDIGRTSRHLCFFEMLGNFSFGDYFKDTAIPLAWEFVTGTLGLDPDRLWVTVHLTDDEAEQIWIRDVGVPAERVQRLDEDNFWRMGDVGPCGPCSEIFWDKGPEYGPDGGPAHGGEERFVEIWNLVFMQYEDLEDGSRVALPKPSIDTGAGLERVLSVLQGVDSVWELDEIRALIATAERLSSATYGSDPRTDISLRILAEHARTVTVLISDGVFPSNEDRGYVLRRILRRAVRHAYLLGVGEPVMAHLIDAVVEIMGADYPDLVRNHAFVRDLVDREESRFRETLEVGSRLLDRALAELPKGGSLPGAVAFQLHDTYGFPLELTMEVAAEREVGVDTEGFAAEMSAQRTRAKASRRDVVNDPNQSAYAELMDQFGPTLFTGREETVSVARVLAVLDGPDDTGFVILDRTPFYAESGGQVGDTGTIATDTGTLDVVDTTTAVPGLTRHLVRAVSGRVSPGQEASAVIDRVRRGAIARNHTATHLLHWALREVLGGHVKQQGSMVGPDRLRFDFSHYSALTPEEIEAVEELVNGEVIGNAEVRHSETSMAEAQAMGAIAFFGDKYGDRVRVLQAGEHSLELCGGTHVSALGDIGSVKIVSEGSIGSNIRRVEAVTGMAPIRRLRDTERRLAAVAEALGVPVDEVVAAAERRSSENRALRDELADVRRQLAVGAAGSLADQAVGGVLVARVEAESREQVRDLAVAVRDQPGITGVVLGATPPGKGVVIVAAVRPDNGLVASDLIAEAARMVGGGTGRNADLAIAGGREPGRLDEALEHVRELLAVSTS